jgi:hypothetical protein
VDCITELSLKPFGTFDEAWGDNVVRRLIHIVLAQIRPDVSRTLFLFGLPINTMQVHCMHVGPTGGGKCVNIDYNAEYIDGDAALFGGNNAFVCPN